MEASTSTMTSFLDRMAPLPNREPEAKYEAAVAKIIQEPASEKGLHLRGVFEKLVKATITFMEHGRRLTVLEKDARNAAEILGFTIPEDTTTAEFRHPKSAFHDLVSQCLNHYKTDPLLHTKAVDVLQTVFEALEDGTYTATPTKGGRTLKLESPTGVRAAIFELDFDDAEMEEDEEEEFQGVDEDGDEADDIELEADESSDKEEEDEEE